MRNADDEGIGSGALGQRLGGVVSAITEVGVQMC